jgi:hypothetical protein
VVYVEVLLQLDCIFYGCCDKDTGFEYANFIINDLLSHGRDAEELPAALELDDIRKLGNRSCLIRGLVLARAKEDGEAELAALVLDDRRVACRHALEWAVLYTIQLDYGTVNCSLRSVIDISWTSGSISDAGGFCSVFFTHALKTSTRQR